MKNDKKDMDAREGVLDSMMEEMDGMDYEKRMKPLLSITIATPTEDKKEEAEPEKDPDLDELRD